MAYTNDDIKANAQKFGPKKPNKFILFVNKNKTKADDNKPSLIGYSTDKDMNLGAVSLWKGKTKAGSVKFTGVNEDLGIKQNVVEMPDPKEQPQADNLDDEIPF
tara:strand:+ start:554 stop:865 length:312 start_codon:yes stop_codon:yes gene_type:complete